ncbi:hypothetical protein E3N88_09476 [Mikania micrantha]|uniref:Major facilitator superfamily (MFS) profile domain-containing protein n=1 Tax=Mikania micrantha TaxID=192012 RepID=A0A5N6PJ51_9ASTR|nr:hypothetical protein E3N88_09476 [Mikania micrantha]
MPTLGWRWLLAISSLPSSLLLIFYRVVPESPRYLCLKGRTTEALRILEKVAKINGQTLPPGILVSDHEIQLNEKSAEAEDAHLLSHDDGTIDRSLKQNVSTMALLFSPELIKPTLLLWVVFFGNAFSYYGLVLLTTELHNGRNSCVPTHLQPQHQELSYKDIFITSFAGICTVHLLLLLKIYPTAVRTTGVGVGSSVGRIGGMTCPLVAVGLIHGCHQTAAIILFEFVIFASGVCVLLFPFETSGRELTDSAVPEKANMIIAT